MFRQTCTAALAALAALASFTLATAQEPKAASNEKQITNSIGMKLTLVPSGEFMMGSGESAEETAAFFNKNYGMDCLTAISLQGRAPAAPRADHQAVLPGHVPCHAGPVSPVRQGFGLQDGRGEGREAGGLGMGRREEEVRLQQGLLLAERGFRADRRAPGGQRKLERRGGLLQMA